MRQTLFGKTTFYVTSFFACAILCMTTGCASGGFKLTRRYAGFINKQDLLIRIVLYILTGIVFAVTMLIDMVVFNTMDFWEGRVSAGSYKFQEGEKTFHVRHGFQPGTELKESTIQVVGADQKQLQEIVLKETFDNQIEMFVDGTIRAKVRDITSLPIASVFDRAGKFVGERMVPMTSTTEKVAIR